MPERVILLDGLTLQTSESGGVFVFELSHQSQYYKNVKLEIEDKQAFEHLCKKLGYLKE